MIKLTSILKIILESDTSDIAKKLGLYHLGYGKYIALGANQQAKLVAISRKGQLKFIGKDKEIWAKKLAQLNETKLTKRWKKLVGII